MLGIHLSWEKYKKYIFWNPEKLWQIVLWVEKEETDFISLLAKWEHIQFRQNDYDRTLVRDLVKNMLYGMVETC